MDNRHKIPNRFFIFGAALLWRLQCRDGWNFSLFQSLQFFLNILRFSYNRWSSKFQIFFVIMAASSFQFPFTRTIGCWQLSGIGEITKIGLYVDIFSRNDRIFVEDG